MVSISQRMRKLQRKLLQIRLGSGALVLPKEVKRIHMRFAPHFNDGHMGPRKFWRQELVRLKYHNPGVPMTVDRNIAQADPAVMSVHFGEADAAPTLSSQPSANERIETINMKNYTNSQILDALVRLTKAQPVELTAEEQEELAKLEEKRRRSERDSKLSSEVRARVRRERELLEQARGEVARAGSV